MVVVKKVTSFMTENENFLSFLMLYKKLVIKAKTPSTRQLAGII